jgi:hypothetical protein
MVPEHETADWPKQIADQVERYVRLVHDKVTVKVVKAIRTVVFGIIGAIIGLTALILFLITVVRLLTILFFGRVWLAHLLIAVLFIGAGSFCMRKRHQPSTES